MSNMSYCRFQNTVDDLEDCLEHITDNSLSGIEFTAREQLINLCAAVLNTFDMDIDVSPILDALWEEYENKEEVQ